MAARRVSVANTPHVLPVRSGCSALSVSRLPATIAPARKGSQINIAKLRNCYVARKTRATGHHLSLDRRERLGAGNRRQYVGASG
ncbi:hypothetical protein DN603_07680 [Raoultella planticola]|uniref:Uncharacterized protein n=1 Tax=Raoultella planticola TaxID=575 RepID=A0A443VQT5_RAOPL|nr:hypothetical protein DN603_07680 [Raoultella planticola]